MKAAKKVKADVILRYPKRPFVGMVASVLTLRETYTKSDRITVRNDNTAAVTDSR